MSNIPENDSLCLKTKLQYTCEKYSKVKVACKCKRIIDQISRNKESCSLIETSIQTKCLVLL